MVVSCETWTTNEGDLCIGAAGMFLRMDVRTGGMEGREVCYDEYGKMGFGSELLS